MRVFSSIDVQVPVCVMKCTQRPWCNETVFTVSATLLCIDRYESGQRVIAILTRMLRHRLSFDVLHTHLFSSCFHPSSIVVLKG